MEGSLADMPQPVCRAQIPWPEQWPRDEETESHSVKKGPQSSCSSASFLTPPLEDPGFNITRKGLARGGDLRRQGQEHFPGQGLELRL